MGWMEIVGAIMNTLISVNLQCAQRFQRRIKMAWLSCLQKQVSGSIKKKKIIDRI